MDFKNTAADVYESGEIFLANGTTGDFVLTVGSYGHIDDAYWHVSVFPVRVILGELIDLPSSMPAAIEVIEQWFEIQPISGARLLHYVARNRLPASPGSLPPFFNSGCIFKRKLLRVPRR
jgi:hypothetical protein